MTLGYVRMVNPCSFAFLIDRRYANQMAFAWIPLSEEDTQKEDFLCTVVVPSDVDWLFITAPISNFTLCELFYNALFFLPGCHHDQSIAVLPNGLHRVCIDLRNPINWFKNKKKSKKMREFKLFIKKNFKEELLEAASIHHEEKGMTWLSPDLIDQLCSISSQQQPHRKIELFCFQLVEKTSGKTAACTFGFGCGRAFHDYTMCTFQRDDRSCGTLLSKIVGRILQTMGYKLWYWGNLVEYMKQYAVHYGLCEIPRPEFYRIWNSLRAQQVPFSFQEVIASGIFPFNLDVEIEFEANSRPSDDQSLKKDLDC